MTEFDHELSIDQLITVSGGDGKSKLFVHEATHVASGAPDWWHPPGGYLTMDVFRALGPIQF